jgi:dipeptidase E
MKLLLISNSTNYGEEYLSYPKDEIRRFLGEKRINALFIPYAGVTISYDDYAGKVRNRFNEIGHELRSIHTYPDPVPAVRKANAIVVGGGNTFMLAFMLHKLGILSEIRDKALNECPFIGWSAGANIASPTICTTNDMPIIQPASFNSLGLVPFQINPHYTDFNPPGHAGETRQARLEEFLEINQEKTVIGLREGSILKIIDTHVELSGEKNISIFSFGKAVQELPPGSNLNFLMELPHPED